MRYAGAQPIQTITSDSTEITGEAIQTIIHRPLNAVSMCKLVANNRHGVNFIDNLDTFDTLEVRFYYRGVDPTVPIKEVVFEGTVEEAGTKLDHIGGEVTTATAYGYGRALRNTHCAVDYGVESANSTIDTPSEILSDLITNRINKNFDGAATGYAINSTSILTMNNPSIGYLKGGYRKNTDIINEVMLAYQAYQDGSAGCHWFVDPWKILRVDQIGNHTVSTTNWPTYWKTTQAASTLQDGDFTGSFTKQAKGYANKIILCTDLRKPAYDYWTEDSGGQALWGRYHLTSLTDSAAEYIVGSHSLLATTDGANQGYWWFPASSLSGDAAAAQKDVSVTTATNFKVGDSVRLWDNTPLSENATIASIAGTTLTMVDNLTNAYAVANSAHCTKNLGWDLSKLGSEESVPTIKFYYQKDTNITELNTWIRLFTTAYDTDYFYATFCNWHSDPDDEWVHVTLPIGTYHKTSEENKQFRWQENGAPDWTNINGLCFTTGLAGGDGELYLDDLHITGKLIREAYNSTEIAANAEVQKIVHMNTSVNDSLKVADDTGTAARLAYAELLTAQATPYVGQIICPLIPDILPGQLIHIHHNKRLDGTTYRINSDFRVQNIVHNFQLPKPTTTLDVTSDVINTFAKGHDASPSANLSALHRLVYVDPEAKSLKTTGIDTLVNRLSVDYG